MMVCQRCKSHPVKYLMKSQERDGFASRLFICELCAKDCLALMSRLPESGLELFSMEFPEDGPKENL